MLQLLEEGVIIPIKVEAPDYIFKPLMFVTDYLIFLKTFLFLKISNKQSVYEFLLAQIKNGKFWKWFFGKKVFPLHTPRNFLNQNLLRKNVAN